VADRNSIAQALMPHVITRGPEYDKWDEALYAHGRILLPKELDEPQQWLNAPHLQNSDLWDRVDRQDQPDGSVILSLKAPTS
jgi:hypothetical protein